jgi:GNAT superfamily N-acetyltransferase
VSTPVAVRSLAALGEGEKRALGDVLIDCVEGGGSVTFMSPMTRAKADTYWSGVAASLARGERIVIVAEDAQGILGSVQVVLNLPENQPHRGDVSKMIVHRRARRKGVGAMMLAAAEQAAHAAGRWQLVLDTVTGDDAERLYARAGWQRVGVIPDFALSPHGRMCSTTVFYKTLRS